MNFKKIIASALTIALSICVLFSSNVFAAGTADRSTVASPMVSDATGRFDIDLEPGQFLKANQTFFLEAWETIEIRAIYTPVSADISFGVISSDDIFFSLPGENGAFIKALTVDERDEYTFAIRNNSSVTVSVSGVINY